MKTRIDKLRGEIGSLMKGYLSKPDYQAVTKLSPHLARLESLATRVMELDAELSDIEVAIKTWNRGGTPQNFTQTASGIADANGDSEDLKRADQQTLRIEIDWAANGKSHEKEIIIAAKAANVLVKFVSRLIEEFGQEATQKLSRIRINRGPLLSKSPDTDFLNRAQGIVYSHKRLPGTEYCVLTHSSTAQKVNDVKRICCVVGLVVGSVQVRGVSRADCYSEIYR